MAAFVGCVSTRLRNSGRGGVPTLEASWFRRNMGRAAGTELAGKK